MKIKPIHHQLANLILENALTNAQIAKKLNICERVIYKWVKDADFQAILDERCEQAKRKAIQLASNKAVRAIECLSKFLEPPITEPEASRKAANDILDWAKLDKGSSKVSHEHFGGGDDKPAIIIKSLIPRPEK